MSSAKFRSAAASLPSLRASNRSSSRPHCQLAAGRHRRRDSEEIDDPKPSEAFYAGHSFFLAELSLFSETRSAIKNVFWQRNQLQPGSVIFLTVELNREATKVSGQFLGEDVLFFSSGKTRVWYSLAGVDVETTPGTYDLRIRVTLPGGRVARTVKPVEIGTVTFRTGDVNVPENFVQPDEASQRKIAADQRIKERTFAHFIATAQWSGDFIKPVEAQPTDSFGMTRIFNEELTSEHRGTDFPIKEGSPVMTSNSGTVVLARELFYEGNCVVLDHGQHLFTIYMHLSKIQVREGQKVRKRQRLGLSGATGRVTGPHLHMGVRWEGSYVDPTKLFALTLPEPNKVVRTVGTPSVRRR
jgi:murein DD-endopeptidase MepM/ murein hydrolase activator NlpD